MNYWKLEGSSLKLLISSKKITKNKQIFIRTEFHNYNK
jgi:hypothetical protein